MIALRVSLQQQLTGEYKCKGTLESEELQDGNYVYN